MCFWLLAFQGPSATIFFDAPYSLVLAADTASEIPPDSHGLADSPRFIAHEAGDDAYFCLATSVARSREGDSYSEELCVISHSVRSR